MRFISFILVLITSIVLVGLIKHLRTSPKWQINPMFAGQYSRRRVLKQSLIITSIIWIATAFLYTFKSLIYTPIAIFIFALSPILLFFDPDFTIDLFPASIPMFITNTIVLALLHKAYYGFRNTQTSKSRLTYILGGIALIALVLLSIWVAFVAIALSAS